MTYASLSRPAALRTLLPFALLVTGLANASPVTVGGDRNCAFNNLQQAVNATPANGTNVIQVANSLSYTAMALVIDYKSVNIIGGFAHCTDTIPTSAPTILDGAGNGGHSVVRFSGRTNATLENFVVQHGHQGSDSHGGGINFTGHGSMTLRNATVSSNSSGYGAGVNISADGPSTITLAARTLILHNDADHSGGGIRVEGDARLRIVQPQTLIFSNTAGDGYGGGIQVIGPAHADIGSPGYGGLGVVSGNVAARGGGIAVTSASANDDALLRLFSTDPAHPVGIDDNHALETGGAIYLRGYDASGANVAHARMCANDFHLVGNVAKDGTGIFADVAVSSFSHTGSAVYLNLPSELDADGYCAAAGIAAGAVACTAGPSCNVISNGIAADANGTATNGAAVTVASGGRWIGEYVQLLGNRGGHAWRVSSGTGVVARMRTCLFADNVLSGALIKSDGNSPLMVDECTLANNTIGGASVFALDDDLSLLRSIIAQPGKVSLTESDPSSTIVASDVAANEVVTIDPTEPTAIALADPRFVDATHGDYHLQAASAAVDFYDSPVGTNARDLDGHLYTADLPIVPNRFGSSDLGPYERQNIGNLVLNDNFAQDLRAWTILLAGAVAFDGSKSTVGTLPSGSAHVGVPHSNAPVRSLSQCIHVPGPGMYQLNGYAFAPGSLVIGHDAPSLNWRIRYNNDTCSGNNYFEGALNIPGGASTWRQAAAPASVEISASQWTRNTTIELSPVVAEGSDAASNDTSAWFDGISLVSDGSNP